MRAGGDNATSIDSQRNSNIRWQEGGISSMTEDPPKEQAS